MSKIIAVPPGFYVLDVMRRSDEFKGPKGDWAALVIDVNPDDLQNCECDFPARFYVDPDEYSPGPRKVVQRWVRIAGKHKSRAAAWAALEDMIATRH